LISQEAIDELEMDLNERRDRDILQDSIIKNQKHIIEKLENANEVNETENRDLNVCFIM
jgi:hypothetical protein